MRQDEIVKGKTGRRILGRDERREWKGKKKGEREKSKLKTGEEAEPRRKDGEGRRKKRGRVVMMDEAGKR